MRMGRGDSGLSIATNNNNTAMQQLHGGGGPPLTPTGKSMRKIDITTSDKFPAGLRVLAVDDDPTCLKILATTLRKCSYEVTTCTRAAEALSLLRENKDNFDLVISDVYMPDMDGFKLLECVGLEMDLPVIMTSSHGETSAVMKGITHGACDYLLKPVRIEELRNIWQHVVRKKRNENSSKDFDTSGSVEDSEKQRRGSDEGDYTSSVNDGLDGNWKLSKRRKDDDDNDHDNEDPSTLKKQRVVWSVELHQQFVNAVNHLGIDKAVPKKILELMNVPGLTRENVASHLQKYRLYLRRLSGVQSQTSANSPFCGTADAYGSICPLDGLTDIRTLAATGQLSQQTLATFQGGLLGRVGGSQQGGGSIVGSLDPSVMMQIPAGGYYGRPSHQQQQPQQPQQQQQQQPQIVTTPSLLSLEHSSSQTLQQLSPVAQTLQQLSPVAVDDVVDVYSGGHGSSSTNTLMMQMQQRQQQQMDPLIGSNMCTASNGRVGYLGGSDKVLANVSGEASFPSNTGFTRTTIGTDNKRNSSSSRNNNNSNIPYGSSSNEVVDPAMLLDGFKDMTSSILSTRGFMANLSLQHLSGNENVLSGFGIGNSVPSLPARFSLDNNNNSANNNSNNNNSNNRPYGDQCLTADNNFNVKLESSGNTDDLLSIVLKQQQHEGMSFDSDYVMM